MAIALGIDFGTSTTIAAIFRNGRPEVIRTATGDEVTPTCVALMPDGKVAVGRAAQNRRIIDTANTLFSFKRILGRTWNSSEVRAFVKQYPFTLERGHDDIPRFVTRAGKLSPSDLTSYVLAMLRDSPALVGDAISHVTLTVPVSFRKEQRTAAVTAAMHGGFSRIELLDEPCAAALAALRGDTRDQTVAIYDLGGGTFDITVLQWSGQRFRVLGLGGDSYLGGDDITTRCGQWVADQVLEEFHWNIRDNEQSWQRLLLLCDVAKVKLSFSSQQEINLTVVDEVLKDKRVTLTRERLEKISMALVQRTFLLCDETLRNAGITSQKVNSVVLSGGCGYMPVVRESIQAYFGQSPKVQLPPDKLVSLGAAIHAGESQASV